MGKFKDIGPEGFRVALKAAGGNLSKAALALKVSRMQLYNYCRKDPEWGSVLKDERSAVFDECLISARIVALGIPEKDEEGRFVGWRERPAPHMLRYLMSTLGRCEGFGSEPSDLDTDSEETVEGYDIEVTFNKKEDLELQERVKNKEE